MAKTVDDLHIAASLLCRFRVEPESGIAGASCSGGYAVSFADRIVEHGLRVATLSDETFHRIARETGQKNPSNPVDAGAWRDIANDFTDVVDTLKALDDDPNVGATVYTELLFIGMEKILPDLIEFHRTAKKPHLTSLQSTAFPAGFVQTLRDGGGLVVDTPERALQALNVLYSHARLQQADNPQGFPPVRTPSTAWKHLPSGLLSSADARSILSEYGVPLIDEETFTDTNKAITIAERMGYPVVLKGDVDGLAHKTEAGLVTTGLRNANDLRKALGAMAEKIHEKGHLVLQRQIEHGLEIMVGARINANVGSVVVLNFGGIFAEAMGVPQTELAPFDEKTAHSMIRRMDPKGVLSGYRGRPVLDVDGLARLVSNFSQMIHHNRDHLIETDLNPVIVCTDDVIAVDASMIAR
jgi:acyl-CoA synthetase (NDP forming)